MKRLAVNNLRQVALATHVYALDNRDLVFNGIRDGGDAYTRSITTLMYRAISNQLGEKVFDCPNLYPFSIPGITDTPKTRYPSGRPAVRDRLLYRLQFIMAEESCRSAAGAPLHQRCAVNVPFGSQAR